MLAAREMIELFAEQAHAIMLAADRACDALEFVRIASQRSPHVA